MRKLIVLALLALTLDANAAFAADGSSFGFKGLYRVLDHDIVGAPRRAR